MQLFSIIVLLILYVYFYTPHWIVNIGYKIFVPKVRMTYIINYCKYDKVSKVITYSFDHGFYDGSLISQYIKQSNSKYKRLIKTPQSIYDDYQIINYNIKDNIKLYSSFTYTISSILKNMQSYYKLKYPERHSIDVGIIVSKRNLLKDPSKLGNYVRTVIYTINVNDSYDKICSIHDNAVKTEQKNNKLYGKGYEQMYMLKNTNINFNSHRELSYIERNDGNKLTLILDKNFKTKEDMTNKMFSRGTTKMVFLNYLNDKWIIRAVYPLGKTRYESI